MQIKTCKRCNTTKPVDDFYKNYVSKAGVQYYTSHCKACGKSQHREKWDSMSAEDRRKWNAKQNANKEYHKNYRLSSKYGLTLEQFNNMYKEQNGQCAICSTAVPDNKICVDHNHNTGRVRHLLCHNCNVILGHAFEDPSILIKCAEYLNVDLQKNQLA